MTKDEKNGKLPGARLLRFSERFFEQPGLEKIALPAIADLQHEYSSRSDKSITRFLILLRGYLGFWKATGIYSLFSSRGDIRPFKSTGFVVLLGASAGVIISLLSWKRNQTPGLWNPFPDVLTALVFIFLFFLVTWFSARQLTAHCFHDIWKIGWKISLTTGIILGTVMFFLAFEIWRFPPGSIGTAIDYLQLAALSCLLTIALTFIFGVLSSFLVRCLFALYKKLSVR